jgi:hypothetical protein
VIKVSRIFDMTVSLSILYFDSCPTIVALPSVYVKAPAGL